MTVQQRIVQWCTYRGLSIADIARGVGVAWPSAYEWTRTSVPTQPHLEKLVRVFGITMEQFYGPLPTTKRKVRA